MSRVIIPETAGKERTRYQRAIVIALRELMVQAEMDSRTYDLTAFIVLMLESIEGTIDQSVSAWEKRGYWIKADRFRLEWRWAAELGSLMKASALESNWDEVRVQSARLFTKLYHVKVPIRHKFGTPWVGAWVKLLSQVTPRD